MKKFICLMVAAVMLCSFCACNKVGDGHVHSHDHTYSNTAEETATASYTEDGTQMPQEASGSSQTNEIHEEGSRPAEEVSAPTEANTELTEYPFTKEASGTLMKKHSNKIDVPFENEYLSAESDRKVAFVCEKYTEKWKTVADRYYKEILYYNGSVPQDPNFSTDAQMHEYIEQRKTQWEAEYEENHKNYLAELLEQYSDTDKAQALCSAYKFDMQREFSLELIGIYEMLGEFNDQEF